MNGAAPRIPWPGEQPEVLVHRPAIRDEKGRWRQPVFDDADYTAAKAGDHAAAGKLVEAHVNHAVLDALNGMLANRAASIVAAHAVEQAGRNAIPGALATYVAAATGVVFDIAVVQANRPFRTQASAVERIGRRVQFDGPIRSGMAYVLIDDHVTLGGTFADLASFIVAQGGTVIAATALTSARSTARLPLDPARLNQLRGRFGKMEQDFSSRIGYDFEGLTNGEAFTLLQQPALEFR